MRKFALMLAVAACVAVSNAQSVAGTIEGVFDGGVSTSMNTTIPNYGEHGFVHLMTSQFSPEEVRDLALPIFIALGGTREGNVSVSVHFRDLHRNDRVVLFQKLQGEVSVYLDGVLFSD